MQFAYLRTCVPLQPVVQINYFHQLGSIFYRNSKQKRKKANREKVTLYNLIAGWTATTLQKNCYPFHPFLFIITPIPNEDLYTFHLPLYIRTPTYPPSSLLINHIFSWKTKLQHTGLDIMSFLSRCKICTNKT